MAVRESRGDIIVFQNSDVAPLTPWALHSLLSALRSPTVGAAFGRQIPRPDAHSWVRRDYAAAFPAGRVCPEWMPLSLPFAAIRRSALERHPFHSAAWGSEDTEWGMWAPDAGVTVSYVPDATVMHSHNYTLRHLYGRRFIEGGRLTRSSTDGLKRRGDSSGGLWRRGSVTWCTHFVYVTWLALPPARPGDWCITGPTPGAIATVSCE